jgi:hypothetical protein
MSGGRYYQADVVDQASDQGKRVSIHERKEMLDQRWNHRFTGAGASERNTFERTFV